MKLKDRLGLKTIWQVCLCSILMLFSTLLSGQSRKLIGTALDPAYAGGSTFSSVIYTLDENGALEVIHRFNPETNQYGWTRFGLTRVADKFWGVTRKPGDAGSAIFSFDAKQRDFQIHVAFSANEDIDRSALVWADGKFWGIGQTPGTLFSYEEGSSALQVAHRFSSDELGFNPVSLTEIEGLLWGVCSGGGANGAGTIFNFNPKTGLIRKVHDFQESDKFIEGSLVYAYGRIYGVLDGVINLSGSISSSQEVQGQLFSISTAGTDFMVEHLFARADNNSFNGRSPRGLLVHDGKLWGVARGPGWGKVYYFDLATKDYNDFHSFSQELANNPELELTYYNGKIWGTSRTGGINRDGTVFSIDPATLEVKLEYTFAKTGPAYAPDYSSLQPLELSEPFTVTPLDDVTISEDVGSLVIPLPERYSDLETSGNDLNFRVLSSTNERIFPGNRITADKNLDLSPYFNRHGSATLILEISDLDGYATRDTVVIEVLPVADLPEVTEASTIYGTPTSSGLVVSRNIGDGSEVSHFQVTDITNGQLYLADGTTPVNHGDFVSFEEGIKGLIFDPENAGEGTFMIQASLGNQPTGLGGEKVKATIVVERAVLQVFADNFQISLGDEIPTLTLAYDGFLEGDTEALIVSPTLSTTATATSGAGLYNIIIEGGSADNYQLAKYSGFITITDPDAPVADNQITKLIGAGTTVIQNGTLVDGLSVFALDEDGNFESWYQSATSINDLGEPKWGVISAADLVWGVTDSGGENDYGIIFSLLQDGSGFTKIHDFDITTGEPSSGLVEYNGYLWGGTKAGFGRNTGVIYRLRTDGTGFEVVHEFSSDDGWTPRGLIVAEGKLWGMTEFGGTNGVGVIFSIDANGNGFQKVFDFPEGEGKPAGELLYYNGRLWGTTKSSRFEDPVTTFLGDDFGTVFSILPDGSDYDQVVKFRSESNTSVSLPKGRHPFGDLVEANGKLWGMTPYGGVNQLGVVFQVDPTDFSIRKVYDFESATGGIPKSDLVFSQGLLWGMTSNGGDRGGGTIFTINPESNEFIRQVDMGVKTGANPLQNGFTVIDVNRPLIANIPDITIQEDSGEQQFDIGRYFSSMLDKVTGTPSYSIKSVSNTALFSRTLLLDDQLTFESGADKNGVSQVTVKLSGDNGDVGEGTFNINVTPLVDGINISEIARAAYGTITSEKLFVSRDQSDGNEISHFQITGITNTQVLKSNRFTELKEGDFLSFDEAAQGLYLKPQDIGKVSFTVQASLNATLEGLTGAKQVFEMEAGKAILVAKMWDTEVVYGYSVSIPPIDYSGFVPGDGLADIVPPVIVHSITADSDVGEYSMALQGGSARNYEIQLEEGVYRIRPKELNIRANDIHATSYSSIPEFTFRYSGFAFDEDERVLTSLPTASLGDLVEGERPGQYYREIQVLGGAAKNYLINRVTGLLNIETGTPETGSVGDPEGRRGKFVLVGTTTANGGTLFSVDQEAVTRLWHLFATAPGGQNPFTGVTNAEDKVWGTTTTGGTNGTGVIYSVDIKSRDYKVEHDFDFTDGAQPNSRLLLVDDRLWGTTSQGGLNNQGIIYSIKTDGTDFRNEHSFDGITGGFPSNGLTVVDDQLWGMTTYGGANQRGVIYSIEKDGSNYRVLHEFGGEKGLPFGDLLLAQGKVWGMTRESPGPQAFFVIGDREDNGAVFSIEKDGSGYTEVHDFKKTDSQDIGLEGGRHPHGNLVEFEGSLWGMTTYGGASGNSNFGTIFKLDLSTTPPTFTKEHDFAGGAQGRYPKGGLTVFRDKLWGLTTEAGTNNLGTVFSYDPSSSSSTFTPVFQLINGVGGTPVFTNLEKVFVDLIPKLNSGIRTYNLNEGVTRLGINLNSHFTDQDGQQARLDYEIVDISPSNFISDMSIANSSLSVNFTPDEFGETTIRIRANGVEGSYVDAILRIIMNDIPDSPTITNAHSIYGTLSNTGLVISKNPLDGETGGYFQITGIRNGRLFLNDGINEILEEDFITDQEGFKGLRFMPTSQDTGFFEVQASRFGNVVGLAGEKVEAFISVEKAPLKVKAEDKVMAYGGELPRLSLSYDGFLFNDGPQSINTPEISTVATSTSDTHTYLLELSGGSAENYELELEDGLLIIGKSPLQVIAENKTTVYGNAIPEFTLNFIGLVNEGDELTFTWPEISSEAKTGSVTGSYPIQLLGGLSDDYDLQLNNGVLNILNAQLVIAADDKEITYGEPLPDLTFSFDGFVLGEDETIATLPEISTNATDTPGFGEYGIQLSGGSAPNYDITLLPGMLKVNKAPLTVKASDFAITYGDDLPDFTLDYLGFVAGDDPTAINLPQISTTATSSSPVGEYPIVLSGGSADNYDLTLQVGTLSIEPAPLTITANDYEITYGDPIPELKVSYEGLKNEDESSVVAGLNIATTASDASGIGSYEISVSGANASNYEVRMVAGELKILPAELIAVTGDKSMLYGAALPAFTINYSGFVKGEGESVITQPLASTPATSASPVGTYAIVLNGGAAANYTFRFVEGNLTIGKAPLTITADHQPVIFGDPLPELTMTYSGFVNGETVADIGPPAISTTATAASGFGVYPITLSGGSADNYALQLVNGNLEIGKAILKVTAEPKQMTYGEAVPILTISYEGFQDGEDESDIVAPFAFTTVTSNTDAGEYPIMLLGGLSNNYIFQLEAGTVTVNKASLSVVAKDAAITYGESLPDFTVSYSGFVNGQDESVITGLSFSTEASDQPQAGSYSIVPNGGTANNYELNYQSASLVVNKAPLKVAATNLTKTYGELLPQLSFTASGFVYGESESDIELPEISTVALASSSVGTYDIELTGGSANNYELELQKGTLTIERAIIEIKVDTQSMTYGSELPDFTAQYVGFVNNDNAELVSAQIDFTTEASSESPVGTYAVGAKAGALSNYDLTVTEGQLTIERAPLVIRAEDKTIAYGDGTPEWSFSFDGLKNDDTASDLELPAVAASVVSTTPIGVYAITLSGGTADNYDISLQDGLCEVLPATLNVVATDQQIIYGEGIPDLSFVYEGFVNGEDASILTDIPVITTTATHESNAGAYPISLSGGAADNYALVLKTGNLDIAPATLTVFAENQEMTYGAQVPDFPLTYAGFVKGDIPADIEQPMVSSDASSASPVGTYPVNISGGGSDNYVLEFNNPFLIIKKASLTITADDKQIDFGDALPELTMSYSGFVNGDTADDITAPSISTEGTSSSPTGVYAISLAGGSAQNYAINLIDGRLSIGKAILKVTAVDKTMRYGQAVPALILNYEGFREGDGVEDITAPFVSTSATSGSPVGDYAITLSGGLADDYVLELVAGTLTVEPAPLIITANDTEITYGETVPQFTVSYSGFVNGEGPSVISGLRIIDNLGFRPGVGTYEITPAGGTADNYLIQHNSGSLEIKKAVLTVLAEDQNMIYGEPLPNLTLFYSGYVNREGFSVFNEPVTVQTVATSASIVGNYDIVLSGGQADNYELNLINGTLTIGRAALFAIADAKTMEYGQAVPALTITYDGFKNGEGVADITEPGIATEATNRSDIGAYPITLNGGAALNYEFILQNAVLTIVKARQVISFLLDGLEVRPGETFPLNATTSSGLPISYVTSDASVLSIEGNIATVNNSGTVTITASQPGDDNHEAAAPVSQQLTITSILEPGLEEELDILYPNPATEFFQVKEPVQMIELFDQQGTLIKRFEGEFSQYNVSDVKRGVYTAFFYKDGKVGMSRMIIWR